MMVDGVFVHWLIKESWPVLQPFLNGCNAGQRFGGSVVGWLPLGFVLEVLADSFFAISCA